MVRQTNRPLPLDMGQFLLHQNGCGSKTKWLALVHGNESSKAWGPCPGGFIFTPERSGFAARPWLEAEVKTPEIFHLFEESRHPWHLQHMVSASTLATPPRSQGQLFGYFRDVPQESSRWGGAGAYLLHFWQEQMQLNCNFTLLSTFVCLLNLQITGPS